MNVAHNCKRTCAGRCPLRGTTLQCALAHSSHGTTKGVLSRSSGRELKIVAPSRCCCSACGRPLLRSERDTARPCCPRRMLAQRNRFRDQVDTIKHCLQGLLAASIVMLDRVKYLRLKPIQPSLKFAIHREHRALHQSHALVKLPVEAAVHIRSILGPCRSLGLVIGILSLGERRVQHAAGVERFGLLLEEAMLGRQGLAILAREAPDLHVHLSNDIPTGGHSYGTLQPKVVALLERHRLEAVGGR
mmetsp:Transcript_32257/g.84247  ORF Transcript_32257/g.84247 Transcript_32257/m.84247 type:complete len:246 (-) Transcript_32257:4351-5088(-)